MKDLYELKEKLCDELKEYGRKEITAGNLTTIDTLAHAVKNIDRILEGENHSQSYRRDSMGRYARGYSYDMVSELRKMMDEAPDDRTRQEFKRFISKVESM